MSAKLNFRYSSMNAGKSAQLLQAAFNYTESGHLVALYTSAMDDRQGTGYVASRIGLKAQARCFDAKTDFAVEFSQLRSVVCVLIDEAQFLTRTQVVCLHAMVHSTNTPVLAYGLRTDFRGEPFEGSSWLLALADDIQEVRSICSCGRKASMSMRLDEYGNRQHDGNSILIGGNNRYRAVCPKCFYEF